MIAGARKLPAHHITIRVPWHDAGWDGTVCRDPRANTHCLVLPRIAGTKNDLGEQGCAGRRFDDLRDADRPPCVDERAQILAPFDLVRTKNHPYRTSSADSHGHFAETPLRLGRYSASCVPFRWMLKREVEGDDKLGIRGRANELKLGYERKREPKLSFKSAWIQDRENQLVMLDTFFGALEAQTSLCFIYAKRTPLSEDTRRVIVGVGRVISVGESTEYRYSTSEPGLRGMLWERDVRHSIRPELTDGFMLPYQALLAAAEADTSIDLESCVAFAPTDFFENYSYGAELLPHDGAIASLVLVQRALERIRDVIPGVWSDAPKWVDRELGRLWKARGAFPGLGSALCAFGLEHGNLIAFELTAKEGAGVDDWKQNPWSRVDRMFDDPSMLSPGLRDAIGETFRAKWKKLPPERRALLELLSRCGITAEQATRYYQETERTKQRIQATDAELLANPYLFFELDRQQEQPIAVDTVDRGLFPEESLRTAFPVPQPSALTDAIDKRRVRALVLDTLEGAAVEGSTVLPRAWTIQRIRERALAPACPVDEDTLAVIEDSFAPVVVSAALLDGRGALQLDRLARTRTLIGDLVRKRRKAPRHRGRYDWASVVDRELKALPEGDEERRLEQRARAEKASALSELFCSRISVLIGSAGTGKTTLLRMLCRLPEVEDGGVLLLAPTGKARVRLEQQTENAGAGKTIAQFLYALKRYDGRTGRYFVNPDAEPSDAHKTVIIDECSMLTEEQLAAVFDALKGVERLVLVGDPRQLPPIGAGRPFIDIIRELAPENVEGIFPKVAPGYAELTIPRRQRGIDDVLLASHFSGRALDAGADEIWDRVAAGTASGVRVIEWRDSNELQEKLFAELASSLQLDRGDEQVLFELSLGGIFHEASNRAYFFLEKVDRPGAARKVESWQILSPVRGTLHGVDALNRAVQARFRKGALAMANVEQFYRRKIPKPLGPQGLLWGDKVINVANHGGRQTYPKVAGAYVANGDIGIVVGEYKGSEVKFVPQNLEVAFATQPEVGFKYWDSEFGSDHRPPPLELAYALTVHKTQGSEFGRTFVVIPNPCRLLSRELLYTALTRQRDELVIFHQGPVREMRRYGDESMSEIAQRMTNLFREPSPREVQVGTERRFLEDRLIHRTERNDLVRSKSEVIIADKLHARGIRYAYEQKLVLEDGAVYYPDFTVVDDDAGVTFYWEHLGMLDDPQYASRWERKLARYRRNGILPHDEGGGPRGSLIVTRDDQGALDSAAIGKLIDTAILGR